MRRTATAVMLLAMLAGACDPSPEGSEATRSPAGANADARHVVLDAVTIAGTGEAHCDPGVRNAIRLLALGGETDAPVACGRETLLQGANAFPQEWRTAVDDLSMLDLPEVGRGADPRGAARLLLDTLDGDGTLITLGPVTNVAQALRADPGFASRVPKFVAMAGAIDANGNAPSGVAEYNVWVDPLAAKEVIEGMDVRLVPLDATDDVPFTPFFADALGAHLTSPEAEAADAIIAPNQAIFLQGGYSFWDTLATALVFRPELATWSEARVFVTASQDAGAGWIDRWDEGAPIRFATAVPDPLAFEREYLSVLTGDTITDVRPDPTVTISFDGRRCAIRPRRLSSGEQVVAYVDERARNTEGAILLQLSDAFTYEDLRDLVGPDGSILPRRTRPPKGLEVLAFVGSLAEATAIPSVIAGLCTSGGVGGGPGRVWLTRAVEVAPSLPSG